MELSLFGKAAGLLLLVYDQLRMTEKKEALYGT